MLLIKFTIPKCLSFGWNNETLLHALFYHFEQKFYKWSLNELTEYHWNSFRLFIQTQICTKVAVFHENIRYFHLNKRKMWPYLFQQLPSQISLSTAPLHFLI